MKNALGSEKSGIAPDPPAACPTCNFKRVLLSGHRPSKSEVEALMNSLEARGALAESGPLAVADSDALAKVIAFRKRSR